MQIHATSQRMINHSCSIIPSVRNLFAKPSRDMMHTLSTFATIKREDSPGVRLDRQLASLNISVRLDRQLASLSISVQRSRQLAG